jgi:uncharacterized membrane protein YgcG
MPARDLHDRSPAAVATRRAYFARKAARSSAPRRTAAAAPPVRAARVARSFAGNPARHMSESPVSGALILWALILGLQLWRRGGLPDFQGVIAISAVTVGVVIFAAIAPEPVTLALVLVLIIAAARSASAIGELVGGVTGGFQRALATTGAGFGGGGGGGGSW